MRTLPKSMRLSWRSKGHRRSLQSYCVRTWFQLRPTYTPIITNESCRSQLPRIIPLWRKSSARRGASLTSHRQSIPNHMQTCITIHRSLSSSNACRQLVQSWTPWAQVQTARSYFDLHRNKNSSRLRSWILRMKTMRVKISWMTRLWWCSRK